MRDVSSAMFVIKAGDKTVLREYLLKHGRRKLSPKEINTKPNSYWNGHCRRTIPQPEELAARLEAVMQKYVLAGNAVNGDPLVTQELGEVHGRQMKLVRDGVLSG